MNSNGTHKVTPFSSSDQEPPPLPPPVPPRVVIVRETCGEFIVIVLFVLLFCWMILH